MTIIIISNRKDRVLTHLSFERQKRARKTADLIQIVVF